MCRYAEAAQSSALSAEGLHDGALIGSIVASVQEREAPPLSAQRTQLYAQRARARIEAWPSGRPPLKLTKVQVLLARDFFNASYAALRRFAMDELTRTSKRVLVLAILHRRNPASLRDATA